MFKRRTDVDSMQFLDQKVFKTYEEVGSMSKPVFKFSRV